MTRNEITRRYPNASESFIRANLGPDGPLPGPEPEQAVRPEPLAEVSGSQEDRQRYAVRITSYRTRLLDPDNLVGKAFVDCLRSAGILPDDTAALMDYSIRQEKVSKKKEERTEIEVNLL